ncbi:MAG: MaoC family dehydratase N-terminal domain-containing protein [Actinomycetota bacterium]|nr:MaoC family dehydratase N-terminal domain-containing protein [Actinomycetota bacterium]
MALNPNFIGRTYPSSEPYLVGREKIREFASATCDFNPAYHDIAAAQGLGYRDLVAPPTFAFTVVFASSRLVVMDPDLGLDYTKVVHGEESFVYSRPVVAGDELVVTNTIENIRAAAGNDMITVKSSVSTTSGELVVVTTMVIVARGTDSQ